MSIKNYEYWFIVGSQELYGDEILKQVGEHAKIMTQEFNKDPHLTGTYNGISSVIVLKPVAKSPSGIKSLFEEAASCSSCAGIITWMHTFSPSKMWIHGFSVNRKPLLHLHTQYNRDIPWASIDMDFMNLNQSAHGDREHGYIHTRMRLPRKVVAGFWQDGELRRKIGVWMRAAAAKLEGMNSVVLRLGDNMREVAVTDGDKIEAQMKMGWQINTWSTGDLSNRYAKVTDARAESLAEEFAKKYEFASELKQPAGKNAMLEQIKIEIALKEMLEAENASAFTTTFQDLHGLPQLPGLAVQRLMEQGYGFGGEGDWKQAMLTRSAKIMASGLEGGVSFMEDYTYHFEPGNEAVLGAHMLEICPSIAESKPCISVHPLGIGGKADPARMVFNAAAGPAVLATIVDLGSRFRMIVNEVETIKIKNDMPKLPVARALWKPYPNLSDSAEAWILCGGTHHSVYTRALTSDYFRDWALMCGIEFILIDKNTNTEKLKNELQWNEAYWGRIQ